MKYSTNNFMSRIVIIALFLIMYLIVSGCSVKYSTRSRLYDMLPDKSESILIIISSKNPESLNTFSYSMKEFIDLAIEKNNFKAKVIVLDGIILENEIEDETKNYDLCMTIDFSQYFPVANSQGKILTIAPTPIIIHVCETQNDKEIWKGIFNYKPAVRLFPYVSHFKLVNEFFETMNKDQVIENYIPLTKDDFKPQNAEDESEWNRM